MPRELPTVLFSAVLLVAVALASVVLFPQQSLSEDPPQKASDARNAKSEKSEQLYELRIYTAAPGKMEALHKRFRDHTLKMFEKHGIKNVGYWTVADEKEPQRLYYIVAYPDLASREKMLIKGIAADPEFLKIVAESEKEGKLTTKIESVLLSPTDYSKLK